LAEAKVGGEIDAFCTRCKMVLAHTVLAMVGTKVARVRCNTCGSDHAHRSAPGARSRSSPSKPREPKVVLSFEDRIAGKDVAGAVTYDPKATFQLEQLVRHPTFGMGIVTAVRDDKIDVAFKASQKTLVHKRTAQQPRPSFHPPRQSPEHSPADKPLAPEHAADPASDA
jgi:hypothetical protein